MVDDKVITIREKLYSILGEEIPLIEPYHYVKLCKIFTPPKLSVHDRYGSVAAVLPYIRQKVKMWGVDVLRAENIKNLIEFFAFKILFEWILDDRGIRMEDIPIEKEDESCYLFMDQ